MSLTLRKALLLLSVAFLALATVRSASGQMSSTNWAGYAINSNGVTAISASWTVPNIQGCASTAGSTKVTKGVAVWIGFDGLTANVVVPEQLGTISACYNGSPQFLAWEEDPTLGPAQSNFANPAFFRPIFPGDHITASIAYLGNNKFQLQIADTTQDVSRTYNVIFANTPRASAEWIVEAFYSFTSGQVSLPGFQPITFSDCSATVNNVTGSITSLNAETITMVDNNGNTIAGPQNLNQAGTSFQVAAVSPVPEFPTAVVVLASTLFGAVIVVRKLRTRAPTRV